VVIAEDLKSLVSTLCLLTVVIIQDYVVSHTNSGPGAFNQYLLVFYNYHPDQLDWTVYWYNYLIF
jgi:hypothetical protein